LKKDTELDPTLSNEILENLKECNYPSFLLTILVLTYLEKKKIINISDLEHD